MVTSSHPIPIALIAPVECWRSRSLLSGVVLSIWAIAMAALFWHFEGRFFKPAGNLLLVQFTPDLLPAAPAGDTPRLMYFLSGDCPCERAVSRQMQELHGRYGARLKLWTAVGPDAQTTGFPDSVAVLGAIESARWRERIPAFPAVAVWDEKGALVYFGPPAAGADCGARDSYVEASLVRVFNRQPSLAMTNDVTGCLCSP